MTDFSKWRVSKIITSPILIQCQFKFLCYFQALNHVTTASVRNTNTANSIHLETRPCATSVCAKMVEPRNALWLPVKYRSAKTTNRYLAGAVNIHVLEVRVSVCGSIVRLHPHLSTFLSPFQLWRLLTSVCI